MPSFSNIETELALLHTELEELDSARSDLPYGAHIDALFEFARVRLEERIGTLHRMRRLMREHSEPRFGAAA
jgi:hypothetical protein